MENKRNHWKSYVALILTLLCATVPSFGNEKEAVAEWQVKGLGFFENRKLKGQLNLIFQEPRAVFDASDIEDAALILVSFLQSQGHLEPLVTATLTSPDGSEEIVEWDKDLDVFLSRETAVSQARFDVERGPRFFYDSLTIDGDSSLPLEEAESFFYSPQLLFQGKESRVYTPALLASGASNLQAHLHTLGYLEATVQAEVVEIDSTIGAATSGIDIKQGPQYLFHKLTLEGDPGRPFLSEIDVSRSLGSPYSRFLMQDIVRVVRNLYHSHGYPEVSISSTTRKVEAQSSLVNVELVLEITPGPQVTINEITFEGSKRTRSKLLDSRLSINPGDLLDPGKLDESRLNLSRIGIFKKVAYEEIGEGEDLRSVRFLLDERPVWNADALLGWGSYEQARLGFEIERINVFGLGHRARIRSIVSMKSLLGEWRYMMPEFLGSNANVSTKLFALDREEVSFDRVEFGFDVAAYRRIEQWNLDTEAVYTFQSLEARNIESPEDVALEDANAGSVEFRIGRDQRDNPLNPKSGYRFFGHFEYAAEFMGGEVDYQRQEMGVSWHGSLSRGLYWHLGLSHGAIGSFSEPQRQVPFVKLFFPGGENSIRGYQRGEAAPADEEGDILGARSYALINLELEQMLSESISAILFFDGLGASASIDDYPFDETLSSLGLGLRVKTFMGPVRFEYGANLNKRPFDPSGTFHFSLGYPF